MVCTRGSLHRPAGSTFVTHKNHLALCAGNGCVDKLYGAKFSRRTCVVCVNAATLGCPFFLLLMDKGFFQ